MNEKLKEKTREALTSVLPITGIVLLLSVTLVPMEIGTLALFLTGAVLLIIGMGFFQLGAEMAMTPLGQGVGKRLMKKKNLLECVSLLSSTILYPYIHFVNRSQLTEIKTKASSASKTVDEESKVLPHGFTAPIDSQRAGHNAECASQRMPAVCAAVPFRG